MSRRGVLAGTAVGLVGSLAKGTEHIAAATDENRIASFPETPYIVPAHGAPLFRGRANHGWDALDEVDRVKLVRGLHPDFTDYHRLVWIENLSDSLPPGVTKQVEFATREQIPGTGGQTIYVTANSEEAENRWGWIRRENNWTRPGGDPVENPRELFAERFDGSAHGYSVQGDGIGIPSVFAPGTLDIVLMGARKAFTEGFSAMFLDSVTTPRLQGLDFSPWAQAAFRNHLASLSDGRLAEIGIENPESLDVRETLTERGTTPASDEHPAEDPLYREYLVFHHRGLKAFLAAYRERIERAFPGRDPATTLLYGNQFLGDALGNAPAAGVYVSEALDLVNIEDNRTVPPEHIREPVYKLMRAASKGEKPTLFEGQMHDQPGPAESLRGLDPTNRYHTLQRLQIAEAYANGVPRKLPLTSWANIHADDSVTHWVQKDGSIPDELQVFADFLWVNRRFLADTEPDNDVAIAYSLPTHVWETAPQWNRSSKLHTDAFRGVAACLRDAGIPYDVRILGHERLYDDDPHLSALADYDAVILPGLSSIADRHVNALRAVADAGGSVVTTARIPDRDEYYQSRSSDWLTGTDVTNLTDDPGLSRIRNGVSTGSLASTLDGVSSVTVDADGLGVNRLRTADPSTLQVHLVNYNYDPEDDAVATRTNIDVSVARFGFEPQAATYVAPSTTTDLDVEVTDGTATVTVPELAEWGFVVFAPSEATLASPGTESTARSSVETLAGRIDRAREQLTVPERDLGLVRAEVFLSEARTALDGSSFEQAEARADAGLSALDDLSVPVTTTESPTTRSTDNPDTSSSDSSSFESTTESTDAGSPGFGALSGLCASAAGAVLALRRVRDDD